MKIIFWTKGNRGLACLNKVIENGFVIDLLVLQAQPGKEWYKKATEQAKKHGIPTFEPDDPNSAETEDYLRKREADLFVLAGYGKIVRSNIISIPKIMCINLHGGKLPEYRGSSPMNWALINGESTFSISIIKVDDGVDTGDVILDHTFPITQGMTIRDLHKSADETFPEMLIEVLKQTEDGTYTLKKQDNSRASYFPLRFPDDGLIFWDSFTAGEIHNRIRALTDPYPCAFSYFNGRKVMLKASRLRDSNFFGEPGRIYLKKNGDLLVCASDRCLWVTDAVFADTGETLYDNVSRYESFLTVRCAINEIYKQKQQPGRNNQ